MPPNRADMAHGSRLLKSWRLQKSAAKFLHALACFSARLWKRISYLLEIRSANFPHAASNPKEFAGKNAGLFFAILKNSMTKILGMLYSVLTERRGAAVKKRHAARSASMKEEWAMYRTLTQRRFMLVFVALVFSAILRLVRVGKKSSIGEAFVFFVIFGAGLWIALQGSDCGGFGTTMIERRDPYFLTFSALSLLSAITMINLTLRR